MDDNGMPNSTDDLLSMTQGESMRTADGVSLSAPTLEGLAVVWAAHESGAAAWALLTPREQEERVASALSRLQVASELRSLRAMRAEDRRRRKQLLVWVLVWVLVIGWAVIVLNAGQRALLDAQASPPRYGLPVLIMITAEMAAVAIIALALFVQRRVGLVGIQQPGSGREN